MSSNRERSLDARSESPSTAVTTPEPAPADEDDIWASDDDHDGGNAPSGNPARGEVLSDLPTIKRQHMTDGYREGLAIGKAQVMQQGFDQGYPIGVQIALRVGVILGVFEGYLAAKSERVTKEQRADLQKLYEKAKNELACSALLKDANDELIAQTTTVPVFIDEAISRWENIVLGGECK